MHFSEGSSGGSGWVTGCFYPEVDYLLKPVNPQRLHKTMQRLLDTAQKDSGLLPDLCFDDSILIKSDPSFRFVKLKDPLVLSISIIFK